MSVSKTLLKNPVVIGAAISWRCVRLVFVLVLMPFLASCFVTTDRLAVYDHDVLSSKDIASLAGHYHHLGKNGAVSSLSFMLKSEPWPYRKVSRFPGGTPPFFPQKATFLAAAEMVVKSEGTPDGIMPSKFEGVAVFSKIPGSDLILIGVPGETVKITIDGRTDDYGAVDANLFFVLAPHSDGIGFIMFSDVDEDLKKDFGDLAVPLRTEALLTYLKNHAGEISENRDTPHFTKSSPAQRNVFEQKIDAALSAAQRREKDGAEQDVPETQEFNVTVSEAAAQALRAANAGTNTTAASEKPDEPQATPTTAKAEQADAPINDDTRKWIRDWCDKIPDGGVVSVGQKTADMMEQVCVGHRFEIIVDGVDAKPQTPKTQTATREKDTKLAQCRAEAHKRIIRCWTSPPVECNLGVLDGCEETVECEKRLNSCNSMYVKQGDLLYASEYYCDPKNTKNVGLTRSAALEKACPRQN